MEAPPGFVLLLSAPRKVTVEALAASFSRASGRVVKPVNPDRPRIVQQIPPGDVAFAIPPSSLVRIEDTTFLVNSVAAPYFADAARVALQLDDLRERAAITSHCAWLSVELVHEEDASTENYGIMAQVAAELLDSDCLALFHPESCGLVAPGEETQAGLRSARPLEAVFARGEARRAKGRPREARRVYRRLHL